MPTRRPRVNVTITEEQHALLTELAELQGRSSASYLKEMLDAATPLLRDLVPALRLASREMASKRDEVEGAMAPVMERFRALGMSAQLDLDEVLAAAAANAPGAQRTERSEGGRAKGGAKAARA